MRLLHWTNQETNDQEWIQLVDFWLTWLVSPFLVRLTIFGGKKETNLISMLSHWFFPEYPVFLIIFCKNKNHIFIQSLPRFYLENLSDFVFIFLRRETTSATVCLLSCTRDPTEKGVCSKRKESAIQGQFLSFQSRTLLTKRLDRIVSSASVSIPFNSTQRQSKQLDWDLLLVSLLAEF